MELAACRTTPPPPHCSLRTAHVDDLLQFCEFVRDVVWKRFSRDVRATMSANAGACEG